MNKNKTIKPDIAYAKSVLIKYKREKAPIEERIAREDERWRSLYSGGESATWIFNSILNKHADIIDSIPTCTCLPRERRDEAYAETLSKIIPVICSRGDFEQVYSDNSWDKLKHGTAVYGVFWNNSLEDGMGDVDVCRVPLSEIFWEGGIEDIQDSKELFIVKLCDREDIAARYGISLKGESFEGDHALRASLGIGGGDDKALLVDWYYKKRLSDGSQALHLCKFVGDNMLFASENLPEYKEGWYHHGTYPVVFDRYYPTGGVCGFGLMAVAEEAQRYINRIDSDMLEYADWASKVRFWAKRSLGVNEKEFLDLDRSIVEVEGDIDEEKLRQIEISPIDDSVVDLKLMKIDELKEITGSRDVSQGGYNSRVTAASAISILREAGAKTSRDGIEETYRAYIRVIALVIELVRQFYSETRIFRIVGEDGRSEYVSFSGKSLTEGDGRRAHFDIEVSAVKKSPGESEKKNQLARELYEAGIFKKENATESLMMLELMDFDGIGNLKANIRSKYLSEVENR